MADVKDYQAHIEQLSNELGCSLDQDIKFNNPIYGMMFSEETPPRVEIPVITDQITYLVCLHELGHIFYHHDQAREPYYDKRFYFDNGVLKSECQAWNWALDQCIDKIQDTSRYMMWDFALGSYYLQGYITAQGKPDRLWNGNRHHVEFVYDEPDEYFTATVKRIQGTLTDYKIPYFGAVKFPFAVKAKTLV